MTDVDRLTAALSDRYTIERELGAGGMATVYLAHDIKHDRQVAIKVLRPELAAVIGAERFLREIKTIASLQHSHILGLIDSGGMDGTAYYVMPFVDGESLRDRLRREKQLPIADVVRIATEVASALDYAHRHGVIHRDIKPENIMLHDGQALVTDFGIALAASTAGGTRMTETGMSLGTPHYMSPEQAMGERDITARSDVYALGCVTYEMLVGEPPFTGPTAQAIIAKVMLGDPPAIIPQRKTVPPYVEAAVMAAIQKLPADRFATAAEFAHALATPGSTTSLPLAGHATGRTGGPSRTMVAAGLLLAVAALIAAFFLGRSHTGGASFDHTAFEQRSFGDEMIFAARFTHDGQSIVYSASSEGYTPRIYIVRPDNPTPQPLTASGIQLLAVSSGDELAVLVRPQYIGFRLFSGTLARMPLGGGAPREILTDVREADWSPDGSQLAVIHEVGVTDQLEYPIGKVLFRSAGYLSDVRVSPKGDRIAFMEHPYKYDDRGVVGVVDLKGNHRVLSTEYWGLQGLAWSTDSRRIYFGGDVNAGFYQVHSVDLAGHDHVVLPSAGTLYMLDISSAGHWLIARDDRIERLFVKPPGGKSELDFSWLDNTGVPVLTADGSLVAFVDAGSDAGATYATMVRRTDSGQAVRLGEGTDLAIAPDKHWVLSSVFTVPPRLMLYPVGAGESRRLDHGEFNLINDAAFFPDGANLLVCGAEPGHRARCYVRPLAGGPLRPVTPEGTYQGATLSPDGRTVLARTSDRYKFYPVDGGTSRPATGVGSDETVIRWSPDGRSLWLAHFPADPVRIDQLDIATGRRQPLATIQPSSRAGITEVELVSLANDPRTYAYSVVQEISQLFVVSGVK